MNRTLVAFGLAGAAALALSACSLELNTTIAADGSGTYGIEVGLTKTDQDMLTSLGSSADEFCEDMQTEGELPEGAAVTREQRGDDLYCVMVAPFSSLQQLRDLYADGDGITVNALELSNGRLVYDVDVDMSGSGQEVGDFSLDMVWKLTVPGTLGEHNADEVEGNTLIWRLNQGESRNLRAASTVGGFSLDTFGGPAAILGALAACLCCLTLLAGAGGGLFFFVQRRRPQAAAPEV